jgi:predicted dinucleotide-binding enzyme
MKVGVLGTGDVGQVLGSAFVTLGHEVRMGAREADNAKAEAWAKKAGARASAGTFADAAGFGELIVLATLGVANESAIRMAGVPAFDGKIVIDTTNPLDFSGGMPPKLAVGGNDSGGEQVQRLLPKARVVKAFNTSGNAHMFRPEFPDGPPDMFICGNELSAKAEVSALLNEFGWGVVDVGDITGARYLEPMCLVWVLYGIQAKTWNHAFKLLKK